MRKMVFTFGRMNPPSVGHAKLVDKVVSYAARTGADNRIYASHSQDDDKNPLPWIEKIRFLKQLFPQANIVNSPANQVFQVLHEMVKEGYTDITMVVGSDRVENFRTVVGKYVRPKTSPNFDPSIHLPIKWTVISAGERDPNATGVMGASGTKLRQFVRDNDFISFAQNVPTKNTLLAKTIFNRVKQHLKESVVYNGDIEPAVMVGKKIYLGNKRDWHIDVIKRLPDNIKGILDRQKDPDRNIGFYHKPTKKFIPSNQIAQDSALARESPKSITGIDDGANNVYRKGWGYNKNRYEVDSAIAYDREGDQMGDQWGSGEVISTPNAKVVVKNAGRWPKTKFHKAGTLRNRPVNEGIHDPSIFKAVFVIGGPGSGKDYIMKQTLVGLGLVEINSDVALEFLMNRENLDLNMPDKEGDKRNLVRGRAKNIIMDKTRLAIAGRLGLILNSTGDDSQKIQQFKDSLEDNGYSTMMVFVNASNEVSQFRNIMRGQIGGRTVPENIRSQKWNDSQKNLETYKKMFGKNFILVDNSTDSSAAAPTIKQQLKDNLNKVYIAALKFIKSPIKSQGARGWMADQKAKRGLREHAGFEGTPELVLNYKNMTPGQETAEVPITDKYRVKSTLKMIRRRIK